MHKLRTVQSQITFLYYRELAPVASFYEDIMGFDLVEDQGYAKIYRVSRTSFVGLVAGDRFTARVNASKEGVMFTLVVDNVPGWYNYLTSKGVKMLHGLHDAKEVGVQAFLFEDPGGYAIEIQRFLEPWAARIFHEERAD